MSLTSQAGAPTSTSSHVLTSEHRISPTSRQLGATLPERIHIRTAALVHEKGLLTDHFFLSGSFNYTLTGITMNDEAAHLFTDPSKVAEQHLAYGNIWAGTGEW